MILKKHLSAKYSKIARESVEVFADGDSGLKLFHKGKKMMNLTGTEEDVGRVRDAFVKRRGRGFDYDRVLREVLSSRVVDNTWEEHSGPLRERLNHEDVSRKSVS